MDEKSAALLASYDSVRIRILEHAPEFAAVDCVISSETTWQERIDIIESHVWTAVDGLLLGVDDL